MPKLPSVVVLAPNSFRRFVDSAVESPFQLHLKGENLATFRNLDLLLHSPLSSPRLDDGFRDANPMAGYYLESFLKLHGYDAVSVFDWNDDRALEEALARDPVAVAFSTTYVTDNRLLEACLRCLERAAGDLPLIVGGPYVWKQKLEFAHDRGNGVEREQMRTFGVDPLADCLFGGSPPRALGRAIYVVHEFGEHTLLRVLEMIREGRASLEELSAVPNLALAGSDGTWRFTPEASEPTDLERDYTRWDLVECMPAMAPIRASVGCPYRCRYCDFIELHPKVIMRSADSIAAEIELAKKRGARFFGFVDDNIFLSKRRIAELAQILLQRELGVAWGGFFRVDRIDESNIDELARSGCVYGLCGIESGDDGQLRRMRKGCRREEAARGIELATRAGIVLNLSLLLGFPGETKESIDATVEFLNGLGARHRGFASWLVYPFYLLPGTAADAIAFRQDHGLWGRRADWRHETMDAREASETWAPYLFERVELSYHYYTGDVPRWWSVEKRIQAVSLRKRLTQAFLDDARDDVIQERFRELCLQLGDDDHRAAIPAWQTVLADRSVQPGRRAAYKGAFEW